MNITDDIRYIGVDDTEIDLFEGQYDVPDGMAYNSYLILDEKTAVADPVDVRFADEWLGNLAEGLGGRKLDYFIIHHMEPDHSGSLQRFMEAYPDTTLVGSAKAFTFLDQFFPGAPKNERLIVKNGDKLNLGKHELTFVAAPMVHWPEVMLSYDSTDKVLFSADAFGKFGTYNAEDDEGWSCEARRYYFGIVGKYGAQVQNVLKAASALDIQTICPLHGPVLNENLSYYFGLYNTWSSYQPENEGVTIAYTSVYGHTKEAAELLAETLREKGCPKVAITDLARDDMAEAVEDAFRNSKIVLATTTYNNDIFPFMKTFIHELLERNYQNRTIGFIENGSWAPQAKKIMTGMFEGCKNMTYLENSVTIKSALTEDNKAAILAMADELMK